MVQIQRTAVGAAMALALVLGGVTVAYVEALGKPNCLTLPCPPPEDHSRADVDQASLAGDALDMMRGPGGPNCLKAPCPPPD